MDVNASLPGHLHIKTIKKKHSFTESEAETEIELIGGVEGRKFVLFGVTVFEGTEQKLFGGGGLVRCNQRLKLRANESTKEGEKNTVSLQMRSKMHISTRAVGHGPATPPLFAMHECMFSILSPCRGRPRCTDGARLFT